MFSSGVGQDTAFAISLMMCMSFCQTATFIVAGYSSFSSASTVVRRPATVIVPGPRLCDSSWNSVSSCM